ncbi:ead/Ea22-like family protein [Klebsiella michiganensis]|uniref:ead/Ea22-like family protein n=1 Tax=Klebsiella TaxID=570 RepID=UPI001F2BEC77|nr:ead/Ea22-like family protein [Klebsiella michiganensis]MCE7542966.1 ead/Ea22-like family protein [Klebsiella michiganensis]MCW9648527.1 ead/Ea22-like family protein [Klebsiella michiganensis]MCW9659934.1 ead/Ea22-like family protein [Klebsiella michiganensis]
MTDITELAQRMKTTAEKATQGEWWADEVKNEGCYGSGDDCVEGFTSYAIYGPDGQTLFDSLNSGATCICEEYDGEGHVAWDETAQRNAEFIALANPANVLALVEALEKAQETIAFQQGEIKALLSSLESRTVTVKLPRPGFITISGERMAVYLKGDVDAAMLAAGIKWRSIDERLTHEELESLYLAMKSHFEVMAESASEAEVIECSQIVRALCELQERRTAMLAVAPQEVK